MTRIVQLSRVLQKPPRAGLGLPGGQDSHDDPRYIRITDISEAGLLRDDIFASQPRSVVGDAWVHSGDVLVASVGATVGKSYLHRVDGEFTFAGYLTRIRPNPDFLNAHYLDYWTKSAHFQDQVQANLVKSTIENLSAGRISKFNIPLVEISLQRAIADYLDHETAEIDEFIADLESMASLSQERFSVDRNAAVVNGAAASGGQRVPETPWLEPLPQTWRYAKLKRLFSITLGKMLDAKSHDPSAESFPYIRAANVSARYFEAEALNRMPFTQAEQREYRLLKGDLLVVEGGSIGENFVLPYDLPGIYLQKTVHRLRSHNPERALPEYYAAVLDLYREAGGFGVLGNQSTIAHLTADKLANLLVPVPPIGAQRASAERISAALQLLDHELADITAAIDLAKERRAALITAAVTGQIDVTKKNRPAVEQLQDDIEEQK